VESNGERGKRLDLSGQDLTLVDCHGTIFRAGIFEDAVFEMANIKRGKFPGADFHEAELDDLAGAKFTRGGTKDSARFDHSGKKGFQKTLRPSRATIGQIMK
jgi:uncharacterized protein YjbI with pentapeptide repeats